MIPVISRGNPQSRCRCRRLVQPHHPKRRLRKSQPWISGALLTGTHTAYKQQPSVAIHSTLKNKSTAHGGLAPGVALPPRSHTKPKGYVSPENTTGIRSCGSSNELYIYMCVCLSKAGHIPGVVLDSNFVRAEDATKLLQEGVLRQHG